MCKVTPWLGRDLMRRNSSCRRCSDAGRGARRDRAAPQTRVFPFLVPLPCVACAGGRDPHRLEKQGRHDEACTTATKTVTVQADSEHEVHAVPGHDHQRETQGTDAANPNGRTQPA